MCTYACKSAAGLQVQADKSFLRLTEYNSGAKISVPVQSCRLLRRHVCGSDFSQATAKIASGKEKKKHYLTLATCSQHLFYTHQDVLHPQSSCLQMIVFCFYIGDILMKLR